MMCVVMGGGVWLVLCDDGLEYVLGFGLGDLSNRRCYALRNVERVVLRFVIVGLMRVVTSMGKGGNEWWV